MITQVFEYNQHFVAMMNIINAARLNPPSKGHKHHIIPRCWFKMNNLPVDNSKDNLVLLTPEDHAKVHKLAYLCSKKEIKCSLRFAYYMTNNIYKEMDLLGSNNPFYGKHHTDESKVLISQSCKAAFTEERRKQLSESQKGRKMSKESSIKKSLATKGVPKSEFGDKFKEHYGIARSDNLKLWSREYMWYSRHNNKCRWEL